MLKSFNVIFYCCLLFSCGTQNYLDYTVTEFEDNFYGVQIIQSKGTGTFAMYMRDSEGRCFLLESSLFYQSKNARVSMTFDISQGNIITFHYIVIGKNGFIDEGGSIDILEGKQYLYETLNKFHSKKYLTSSQVNEVLNNLITLEIENKRLSPTKQNQK